MKNSILKNIAIGLIIVFPFASCSDFLEETNPNALSTDNFWKTQADLELGLTSVYNSFKNSSVLRLVDEYQRSDMTWPGWGRPNTNNEYFLQTFNESSNAPNDKWTALYTGIFRANQVIEAYNNLKGTFANPEAEKETAMIEAQARFFRGLYHFYLYTSFNNGSVIMYDFVPKDESEFYQTVSPAEEVQAFYRADLEYARENLPPVWYENKDKGRATSGAATALLGKSYLYAKDYETAATYFKDVIDNPDYGYALTNNIGENFTTWNEFNEESILEISYSLNFKSEVSIWDEEQTSTNMNYSFSPVGGWRSLYPACWLQMAYKNEKMDTSDPRNYVLDDNGDSRLRSYSLRTSWSIALVDDLDQSYYQKTSAQGARYNNGETAYWRKYTNWDIVESERDIVPSERSGINVRVIRLADVYLMYAEALIKGGTDASGVNEAMRYINRVRKRSALELIGPAGTGEYPSADHDGITYNAQSLMNHLMYVERPLELSAEGHAIRTIDMRRWGITKQRFDELAVGLYNQENFPFVDEKGNNATRWGSVLVEVATAADAHARYVDRSQPAANYLESSHGYWPLPNGEITANPQLNTETN